MKQILTLLFSTLFSSLFAQNILFVDDNDFITDNTDSMLISLQGGSYSAFDYYNASDSASTPSSQFLSSYDLVIWYASTDGVGLKFWNAGNTGDPALVDFLLNGGRLWVIGTDLLYAGGYTTPTTFSGNDFAFEYMGLQSYNVQSYGDDAGTGVSEVTASTGTPNYFPTPLTWIFPTAWWVDGVSPRTGAVKLYEMGPNSYALYQAICMTRFTNNESIVLSTFFDPALISTPSSRLSFIENSIFYILNFDLNVDEKDLTRFQVFPNPTSDWLAIESNKTADGNYTITNNNGKTVKSGKISQGKNSISLKDLSPGIYFVTIDEVTQKIVKY